MKIIGICRARNEERWIGRVVASLFPLCSEVLLMDDHSTDATACRASSAGAIVLESPFDFFQETRDKNWLHAQALDLNPDWVVMVDGDEMLAPGAAAVISASIEAGAVDSFRVPIWYLWDREDQIRTDRLYGNFTRPSIYRVMPGQKFQSTYPTGLHCGNTPAGMTCDLINAPLLHFGYMHREDRLRKHDYYNRIDPGNDFEDHYNHMILGDAPEFPAERATKWAGPLKLETINT